MKAKDIKSVDDVSNYIEGCLNDFNEGISTLDETNKYLHELTVRVIKIAQASLQHISEEEIEEKGEEFYLGLAPKQLAAFIRGAKLVLSRGVAKESVESLPKRFLSKKMIETEAFVDACIRQNGEPPTYRQVQEQFNLKSMSTAYARLRHCRDKMKKRITNQ